MFLEEMFEVFYHQCNNYGEFYCKTFLCALSVILILLFYGILKFSLNYFKVQKINDIIEIKPNHWYLGYTLPFLPSNESVYAHKLLYNVHENSGGVAQFTFYNQRFIMISRPGLVKNVLKNVKGKGIPIHKSPTRYDNRNIFNLDDGDAWKIRRRLFRVPFNNVNLQCMENELKLSLQNLIDYIDNKLDDQYDIENDLKNGPLVIKLDAIFSRFALQVISNVGFQMNINCFDDTSTTNISKAVDDLFQASQVAYHPLSDIIIFLGTFFGHPFTDARRVLLNYTDRIYDHLKCLQNESISSTSTTTSILSSAIAQEKEVEEEVKEQHVKEQEQGQEEVGHVQKEAIKSPTTPQLHPGSLGHAMMLLEREEGVTPDDVKNEIFLMFIAGHETTSHTLSWFFHSLAKYPDVKRHVFNELDSYVDSTASVKYTGELPAYTEAVLRESMRRYPVVFVGSARRVNQREGVDLHIEEDYPFGSSLDTTSGSSGAIDISSYSYSGSERCHTERMAAANRRMFKNSSNAASAPNEASQERKILHIPHGTWIQTNTYALHHDKESWDLPFSFQPERWLVRDEEGVPVVPYQLLHDSSIFMSMTASSSSSSSSSSTFAFAPFSIGPRNCVGMNLALMEIRATIRVLCKRYTFHFPNHLEDKMMHDDYAISTSALIMQPRDKLPVVVHRRPIKKKQKQKQQVQQTNISSALDPKLSFGATAKDGFCKYTPQLEQSSDIGCSGTNTGNSAYQSLPKVPATNNGNERSSITDVDREIDDSGYNSDDEAEPMTNEEVQENCENMRTTNDDVADVSQSSSLPLTTTQTKSVPVPLLAWSSQAAPTLQAETKVQSYIGASSSDFEKDMDLSVELSRQQLIPALDRASSDPHLLLSQQITKEVMQPHDFCTSSCTDADVDTDADASANSGGIDVHQTESPSEHTFVLPLYHQPPPTVSNINNNEDTTISAAAHQPITSSTAIIDNHTSINVEPVHNSDGGCSRGEETMTDVRAYSHLREITNTTTNTSSNTDTDTSSVNVRNRSETLLEDDMEVENIQEDILQVTSIKNAAQVSDIPEKKDDEEELELESTSVAALTSDWQSNIPSYNRSVANELKDSTSLTSPTNPPLTSSATAATAGQVQSKPNIGRIKLSRNPLKFFRRITGQEKADEDTKNAIS